MARKRQHQLRPAMPGDKLTATRVDELGRTPPKITGGRGIKVRESAGRHIIELAKHIITPRASFFGIIASSTGAGSRWTYTVDEAIKTGSGYAGWATRTNGRQVTAYNCSEVGNTASLVGGVDVNGTDYPAGFAPVPVADGTLVLLHRVSFADDSATEWWFEHGPTAHDGTCEAAP